MPAVHAPIIDADLWDAVQTQLRGNGRNGGSQVRNKTGATLRGLVHCGRCGSPMLHTFTTRGERRHRYYTCSRAHNEGVSMCPKARVAAGPFEAFIADQIKVMGTDEVFLARTAASVARLSAERRRLLAEEQRRLEQRRRAAGDDDQRARFEQRLRDLQREIAANGENGVDLSHLRVALAGFQPIWDQLFPREQERILRLLIERITYDPETGDADIELRPCGIEALAAEAST